MIKDKYKEKQAGQTREKRGLGKRRKKPEEKR